MKTVIASPDEVTPVVLTAILCKQFKGAYVKTVRVLMSKDLPYSTVARLGIEYSSDHIGSGPPRTLFLKLSPSANKLSDIGQSEVDFYRLAASSMTCPPMVKCYDAIHSPQIGRSHIFMEDLTETHSQTEQNTAPVESATRKAVRCLAEVHARWWDDPGVGNKVGRVFDEKWLQSFIVDLNDSVERFLRFLGKELSSKRRDVYRRMLKGAPSIWGRLTDRNGLTVTHGDTHWWNFLYPNDQSLSDVRIFDWHLWHIDLGARDLASLIALGGFAEPRPEIEMDLLRYYYASLLDLGVRNYSWNRFWNDYRMSAVRNLNMPIIFWSQGKHESTWRTTLERAFRSYEILALDDLL